MRILKDLINFIKNVITRKTDILWQITLSFKKN